MDHTQREDVIVAFVVDTRAFVVDLAIRVGGIHLGALAETVFSRHAPAIGFILAPAI